jgi:hypothetical protein
MQVLVLLTFRNSLRNFDGIDDGPHRLTKEVVS